MAQPNPDTLSRASELLRSGYKEEARGLLVDFLKQNPNSARGWWLMSFAASDAEHQISCLKRVLLLQPDHPKAKSRLAALTREVSPRNAEAHKETWNFFKTRKLPLSLPALGLLIAFGCLGVLLVGYFGYKIFFAPAVVPTSQPAAAQNLISPFTPTASVEPVAAQASISTPQSIAASTASPEVTVTPLVSGTPTQDPNATHTPIPENQIGTANGQYPPDFTLINAVTNAEVNLREYIGQPVLIVFLGTMSPGCDLEMPGLQAVYAKYQDQGLVVLGVGVGASQAALRTYSGRFGGLTFPLMSDWEHDIARLYEIKIMPTNFFIRKNGKIWQVSAGMLTEAELEGVITSIMKTP